ncbi:MAG: sodium-dependent transporter [Planctomycetaceae bacterium]
MTTPMKRERWGTRIGLVLAMAGNAVGLGNFLRFPRLAAEYGGGAFIIPYLVALVLLGIPLMWLEWAMGRYGGQFGHSTTPGMLQRMWRSPLAKYVGSLGISLPLLFAVYYTYVESWTLAYACFSVTGEFEAETAATSAAAGDVGVETAALPGAASNQFLRDYQGITPPEERRFFTTLVPAISFWLIAVGLNCWIIARGISGGIERLAKVAMPALFLFAIVLAVRVLTYGTPDPLHPERSVWVGLNYVWQPQLRALADFEVWLVAAGQIFFTLSIGTGTIQCYASYLRRRDDCALTGLTTAATNEFAEVVLGGTIAIPMAVATFGLVATQTIAAQGSFNLGFVAMPVIFHQMPAGQLFATLWFLLLFFAGITSSVAMCQPLVAFLQDEFRLSRRVAAGVCCGAMLGLGLPIVLCFETGYMDQYDFWVGTFGLVICALAEVLIFGWAFGKRRMWAELRRGAEIRIPRLVVPVIRYVVPVYLSILLAGWMMQELGDAVLMKGVPPEHRPYLWLARATMAGVIVGTVALVGIAWRRRANAAATSNEEAAR